MRILIFHGYLLRGTGSNVYNASLARALAGLGHDVHLLCQDRGAARLSWVDRVGSWRGGRLVVEETGPGAGDRGSIAAYLPDIGGLLPLYVRDRYQGFEVKTFPELSHAELDRYLEANVAAVREVAEAVGGVDAALANHLVMGPAILARAELARRGSGPTGFAAKIHGSALEYTVKPHPGMFLLHAREGMAAATGVLVGSRHTAESLWRTIADPSLRSRTRLGPPGVDTEAFAPSEAGAASAEVRRLAAEVGRSPGEAPPEVAPRGPSAPLALGREPAAASRALEGWAVADGPRVAFVGKLIVSKGVDLLLAAWPLVVAENPGARLLVVAFGEFKEGLARLLGALDAGDLDAAREVAALGRSLEGGPEEPLEMLEAFLADPPPGYADAARRAARSVHFAGRLEHDEVARLLPAAEALVMPSTFPESFGMVAAEAAACGVLPVSAAHSGMQEVSRHLAAAMPSEVAPLLSFPLGPGAVVAIAERLNRWLSLDAGTRAHTREALAATTRRLWSWEEVARGVLAASAGRLDEIPRV